MAGNNNYGTRATDIMKKLVFLVLLAVLFMSLVRCNRSKAKENPENSAKDYSSTESTEATTTTEPVVTEPPEPVYEYANWDFYNRMGCDKYVSIRGFDIDNGTFTLENDNYIRFYTITGSVIKETRQQLNTNGEVNGSNEPIQEIDAAEITESIESYTSLDSKTIRFEDDERKYTIELQDVYVAYAYESLYVVKTKFFIQKDSYSGTKNNEKEVWLVPYTAIEWTSSIAGSKVQMIRTPK